QARGLFAGLAAHGMVPLDQLPTAAFGMILAALAHVDGWPFARGGSRAITDAMAAYLRDLGGEIITGVTVKSLRDLPPARATLLDVTPRQLLAIADEKLPQHYRQALSRYRYGMGACKVDYALSGPVPWTDKLCARAGVVHLGGAWEAIAAAERATWEGRMPEQPLVLVAQPSQWDPTRAPAGKHVLWAYCHTPHASPADVSEAIEQQIERFAPGFRGRILARHVMTAQDMEAYNPNYVGGAINGGAQTLDQLFTRPTLRANPYTTPVPGLFLCSSATPPGGGVHGMCGYHAALAALRG
ncbi:MAG TPA: NAD(P)/FAD-dependent oxidoreductase, partial [Ktedonobacterales bacterium]